PGQGPLAVAEDLRRGAEPGIEVEGFRSADVGDDDVQPAPVCALERGCQGRRLALNVDMSVDPSKGRGLRRAGGGAENPGGNEPEEIAAREHEVASARVEQGRAGASDGKRLQGHDPVQGGEQEVVLVRGPDTEPEVAPGLDRLTGPGHDSARFESAV